MNAKEKAKELYNKYEFVYIQNYTSSHDVKQCAIIAVDELIESYKDFSIQEHGRLHIDYGHGYWQEVKKEIKKL